MTEKIDRIEYLDKLKAAKQALEDAKILAEDLRRQAVSVVNLKQNPIIKTRELELKEAELAYHQYLLARYNSEGLIIVESANQEW